MAKSFEIKLSNEKIKPLLDKLKSWCDRGQLEPRNYEVLTKMITKCENYDDAISILEIATQSRKTGLFYRHQFEKIDTNKIHYLAEDKKMSFGNKGITNKLIIGDNYLSLENLLISYQNKIDVIYIDPPYGCNDMGEFANVNYENNISRDNLLSQLSPRLELARQLLKNDGIIFVSIDDKNQAYVKCLMDDTFGEINFLCNFVWGSKGSGAYDKEKYKTEHEYVLAYSKNVDLFSPNKKVYDTSQDPAYSFKDERYEIGGKYKRQAMAMGTLQYSKSLDYPVIAPDGTKIYPGGKFGPPYLWRWQKEKLLKALKEGFAEFVKTKNGWTLYSKQYEKIDENGNQIIRSKPYSSLGINALNRNGTELLRKIMSYKVFPNPKPIELLNYLFSSISNKNAIFLDFYAGSGTTGHAVLEMNKIDGGNRKFILCTNEDKMNDKLTNGIGTDVTYERLKRIMTGQSSDNSNFQWIKENDAYGQILKVYKIAELENFKKEIFELINPLDYDYKCLSEKKKIEWICKNFEQTQKILKEKK